jgi:uncharacterized protein
MNAPSDRASASGSLTVAISGSTGMVGSALVSSLRADGHRIRRLVRGDTAPGSEHIAWDPGEGVLDPAALEGIDAVVHLAGENIGQRWSPEVKRRIYDSRIDGTRLLSTAIASQERKPEVMVSASAVGIYGDRGDEVLDEGSRTGSDFLSQLGRAWEASTESARQSGVRVVNPRFAPVLSPRGGALERMLPPFRAGIGGRLGSGDQWMSWVSLTDAVRAIRFALEHDELDGPVNVVAPNPVTNKELTRALGDVLGRPTFFFVPATALRLVYGEMAEATLLASQRARPRKLQDAGFSFEHPEIRQALEAELARDG